MEDKCFKTVVERCRYMAMVAKNIDMKNTLISAANEIERLNKIIEEIKSCTSK